MAGKLAVMNRTWDCTVIGGGAAGLSAALVLGRARRRTLLVDAGGQSNLCAPAIGGLLGHDGRPPAELYAAGRQELTKYPTVEIRNSEITTAKRGFEVALADGTVAHTRTVLLATGMEYRCPNIPGLDALWGGSAFHCPFCHGWEVRDQPLAVLAEEERAVHSALLLRAWSDDIMVLSNGSPVSESERQQLSAAGIDVDTRTIAELSSRDGGLDEVVFDDGFRLPRRGVLVAATLHQRSALPAQLGLAMAPPGPVVADAVAIDAMHRTSVPGVFAAGDVSTQVPQVAAAAVAAGSLAASAVVQTLQAEDVGLAVPDWPEIKENADAHA